MRRRAAAQQRLAYLHSAECVAKQRADRSDHADGVVESDEGRQPKPRYRATGEGVLGYQGWLRAQVGKDRRQARLFARQLAFLAHNPTAALEIVDCLEQASLEEAGHAKAGSAEGAYADGGSGLADELESEESRLVSGVKLEFADYYPGLQIGYGCGSVPLCQEKICGHYQGRRRQQFVSVL